MMRFAASAAFVLFVAGILRMLVTGSAMAGGGGFDRQEEPTTYWAVVIMAAVLASVFLGFAIFG